MEEKMKKKYLTPEELAEVKKIDLLTYLYNYEPNELVGYGRGTFGTKTHSSLTIRNGLWTWWVKGIGGRTALDYLIKVEGMNFLDAALLIDECITKSSPTIKKMPIRFYDKTDFKLPPASPFPSQMYNYLTDERHIDREIVTYYFQRDKIFESKYDHSIIFVGYNNDNKACFASKRSTTSTERRNIAGSDKRFSFRLDNDSSQVVHIFESPIDLMSFQTLQKMKKQNWNEDNYLSIDGASLIGNDITKSEIPVALQWFLMNHPKIETLVLHLDNDRAGMETSEKIKYHLADRYEIQDCRPKYYKDMNELLTKKMKNSHDMIR